MFRLMLITDARQCKASLEETVRLAVEGGADAVQLREKALSAKDLFALAEQLRRITADRGAALIINHRADVALAVDADGVHLGWRSMGVADVRSLAGDRLTVGVSCHSAEDVRQAERAGADYAVLGPVFPTPSKEGLVAPLGLEALRAIVAAAQFPVLAVGGIKEDNVVSVARTGVAGVAVISALASAPDPRAAAERLAAPWADA